MTERLEIPEDFRRDKIAHLPISGKIPIAEIKIGPRHRKDLGDLQPLVNSIKEVGLLQPVVLNGRDELICGHRRIEAFKRLGRQTIPFRVLDVPSMLQAENDENEIRKSFALTERAALAEALEAEIQSHQGRRADVGPDVAKLRADAKEERQRLGSTSAPRGQSRKGTRVAKAAGFSSRQERARVKTVMTNGVPKLIARMDAGEIDPTTAEKIAKLPVVYQRRIAAADSPKAELKKIERREEKSNTSGIEDLRQDAASKRKRAEKRPSTLADLRALYLDKIFELEPQARVKEIRCLQSELQRRSKSNRPGTWGGEAKKKTADAPLQSIAGSLNRALSR